MKCLTGILILLSVVTVSLAIPELDSLSQYYQSVALAEVDPSIKCTQDSDCNHGECRNYLNSTTCFCDSDYASYRGVCNYQKKPRVNAFLASFLGGFVGADWFYLSEGDAGKYVAIGVVKCVMFIYVCYMTYAFVTSKYDCFHAGDYNGLCACISGCTFSIIPTAAWIVWWLADWIRIAASSTSFKDGNGIPLGYW